MPRLYTYVVRHDTGFAPNPYHGYCTLACCKPLIRKYARLGDWIMGGGSVATGRGAQLVYVMQVSETLTFDEYWHDPRFVDKKPCIDASYKDWVGDNIYPDANSWQQLPSMHSEAGCSPCEDDTDKDLSVDRILVGKRFVYWGGDGPLKPHFPTEPLYFGIGHKFRYKPQLVTEFLEWVESLTEWGVQGSPGDVELAESHRQQLMRASEPALVAMT